MASIFPTISNALDRALPGGSMNDRRSTEKLAEQNESLKNISKILVKNNNDMKKDFEELKKYFALGTSEFSKMRENYERTADRKPSEKVKERTDNSPSMLQRLVGSLTRRFGSKDEAKEIELKSLEELRIIKGITTKTATDIEFIRSTFTESSKKKDRELLAQAIANALDMDTKNEGILSSLGGILGGALATLGTTLLVGFKLGFSGLTSMLKEIPGFIKKSAEVFAKLLPVLANLGNILAGIGKFLGAAMLGLGRALAYIPLPWARAASTALTVGGAALTLGSMTSDAEAQGTTTKKETELVTEPRDKSKESFLEGLWNDTKDWIAKGKREDAEREAKRNAEEQRAQAQLKTAPAPAPQTDPGDLGSREANQQVYNLPNTDYETDGIFRSTVDMKEKLEALKERIINSMGLDIGNAYDLAANSPIGKLALEKLKGLGELQFDDGKINVFSGVSSLVTDLYNKGMEETKQWKDAIEETVTGNPPVNVNSSTVVTGGTNQQIAFSDATPISQSASFRSWLSNNGVLRGGN